MKIVYFAVFFFFLTGAPLAFAGTATGKVVMQGKSSPENIVVYLEGVKGNFSLPKQTPDMDHKDLQFAPRALAITTGTTVSFPNADTVFHSAFSISKSNPFELGLYGPGREKSWTFQNPGMVEIFCHIHSHMAGFILVLDHPFYTSTAKDGSFTIPDIPDGTYQIKAWMGPSTSAAKTITLKGKESVSIDLSLSPGK